MINTASIQTNTQQTFTDLRDIQVAFIMVATLSYVLGGNAR